MKRMICVSLIIFCSCYLLGCMNLSGPVANNGNQTSNEEIERQAVASVVESFGQKLRYVSLLAPVESVYQSLDENYGSLVSPALLTQWKGDPYNAPGRLVSSPWPDHIEISSLEKIPDGSYQVRGQIIEITSQEQISGGYAAKRPIIIVLRQFGGKWLIDTVELGDYIDSGIVYRNTNYGFTFSLPPSWRNYSIITTNWEGRSIGGQQDGQIAESGTILSIRHPDWTATVPRQDIPIMIFSIEQWSKLLKEEFSVGAAPIPPKEIGRNSRFVFALPARYNYAFPVGFEEVENILDSKPLHPMEMFE